MDDQVTGRDLEDWKGWGCDPGVGAAFLLRAVAVLRSKGGEYVTESE